jgi:hypothetical protein
LPGRAFCSCSLFCTRELGIKSPVNVPEGRADVLRKEELPRIIKKAGQSKDSFFAGRF